MTTRDADAATTWGIARRDLDTGREAVFSYGETVDRARLEELAAELDRTERAADPDSSRRHFVVRLAGPTGSTTKRRSPTSTTEKE